MSQIFAEERKFPKIKISPYVIITIFASYLIGRLPLLVIGLLSIIFHESAHALCAHLCGFTISSMEILPIGAMARIEGLFENSELCEIAIALAGPVASIVIACIGYCLYYYNNVYIYNLIMMVNLSIASVNMMPALPMDGGRVLRAILSNYIGIQRATRISCTIGIYLGIIISVISFVLGFLNLVSPAYIMLGIVVSISSYKEKQRSTFLQIAQMMMKKERLLKQGSMKINQIAVPETIKLYNLVSRFLPRAYHMVVVVDYEMCPVGYVSEGDVVKMLMEFGAHEEIGHLIRRL